jgi:GGDEF domain-containing protein
LVPDAAHRCLDEIRAYWTRLETTVEERTRLADELRRLALVDELTGLRNRRGLTVASEPILSLRLEGRPPALLSSISMI